MYLELSRCPILEIRTIKLNIMNPLLVYHMNALSATCTSKKLARDTY